MDDAELLAAIGRMVVSAAQLEYSVAELVTVIEGLQDKAGEDRAVEIVEVTGEAMRQFRKLADQPGMADPAPSHSSRHDDGHPRAAGGFGLDRANPRPSRPAGVRAEDRR